MKKTFASDNSASVHPEIMDAMLRANQGHAIAYGDDVFTQSAIERFRAHFGEDTEVAFVYNGTGANVIGLKAMTQSFHAILCSEMAHINVDECNAPELFTGCKLIPIPTEDGKLTVEQIEPHLRNFGVEHHPQPRVIAITQTTEFGTIYRPEEIQAISDLAHQHGMLVHMDGARIANATAALGVSLREITRDVGVDVLSFGGTKNGMMFGEAILVFDQTLVPPLKFFRKQGMQLNSKMRFIAAQFDALLSDDLWLRNARHANQMATLLVEKLHDIPGVTLMQPVEANGIFACIPQEAISVLQEHYYFYVWDEVRSAVRWMTAFDTTQEDIEAFTQILRTTLNL